MTTFTWVLEDFSSQPDKVLSDVFQAGDCRWRIFCFPRGNHKNGYISLYLLAEDAQCWTQGQSCAVNFELTLINHSNAAAAFTKEAHHNFTSSEQDWGFTAFIDQSHALDADAGFLQQGGLTFRVQVVGPHDTTADVEEARPEVAPTADEATGKRRGNSEREKKRLQLELQKLQKRLLVLQGDEESCRACSADDLDSAVSELESWVPKLRKIATKRRIEEAQAEATACMICWSNPKDLFLNCGHLVCRGCGAGLKSCPACRKPVTAKRRAFV